MTFEDWYRQDRLPHIYCAGCGNGTIINCTLAAIDQMGWKKEETVFVSGIGCSSRAPGYIITDSLHTTHGRALAFATGVKMANPNLNVVVFTGDGDLAAIGGNHFIHSCRRNIDITVVCMNNQIYGMTGGQGSPTTPKGCLSSTTPFGCAEMPFDLCELATAAGANYVSRWTSYHVKELEKAVKTGLETPGFSFIEALVQCPTAFGRRNKFRQVADHVEYLKSHSLLKAKRDRMLENREKVPEDMFVVGELTRRSRPAMGVKP
jgi:2-oxoglutarate ferredoxin oxidoreductase subunit beta